MPRRLPVLRLASSWTGLLLSGLLASQAFATLEASPSARVVWTDVAPVIDGFLDEEAWADALVIDRFTQAVPDQGEPVSERTVVRILSDRDHLYIGIRCYDREPEKIIANRMGRDDTFFWDDRFNISIDTFHDRRNGYFFQVNSVGGRRDGLIEGPNFESNWDGIWYASAHVDEQGWVAEIAIPYKSVSFDPDSDSWGLNMSRGIRRKGEEARWADPDPQRIMTNMGTAGTLEGLTGIDQGLGLDIVPGSTLRYVNQPADPGRNVPERSYTRYQPSLDVFYKILPSFTGSLTVNTDFGATEVDEVQANLTRFALFFPEKRDFFLQDALIFDFGGLTRNNEGSDQNGRAFFSRQIGLAPNGEEVSIRAGTKLTGRIGDYNIGFLNTQLDSYSDLTRLDPATGRPLEIDRRNLTVARIARNVLEESRVGFILTNGDPRNNASNTLLGFDADYRDSSFLGGNSVLQGNLWFQTSFTEDVSDDQLAWGAQLEFPNDIHNWLLRYKEIESNFNPALGFVNRRDIRRYEARYRYRTRTSGVIRTFDQLVTGLVVTDLDNDVETGLIEFRPVDISTDVVDGIELTYRHSFEDLDAPFLLLGKSAIPAGSYHFDQGILEIQTSFNRPLRFEGDASYGTFFNGERLRLRGEVEWRPSPHWLFSIEYDHNEFWLGPLAQDASGAEIGERRIRSRIARLRLEIHFSPSVSWITFAQYDNVSDQVGIQSRFRWIVSDGREFFIVLNQGVVAEDGDLRRGRTEPLVQAVWTLRF